MAEPIEIGFGFDPTGFINGVGRAARGLEQLTTNIKRLAMVGAGYLGFRGISAALPEIGKTASIAGDIIQQNLFWPLRQELAPLLQGFLNWARDHRAMFVLWGVHLVNVFRTIKEGVLGAWEIVKTFFKSMSNYMKSVFGESTSTFTEMLNMFIGKIAATIIFLELLLEPVAEAFGKLFGFVATGLIGLVTGFGSKIGQIAEVIGERLVPAIVSLFSSLTGGTESAKRFFAIWREIGSFLGDVVVWVIGRIAQAINNLAGFINGFVSGFQEAFESLDIMDDLQEIWQAFKDLFSLFESSQPTGEQQISIWRTIGKVVGWLVGGALKLLTMAVVGIIRGFKLLWEGMKALGGWIASTFKPLWDGLTIGFNVIKSAASAVVDAWRGMMAFGAKAGDWINENIIQPFSSAIDEIQSLGESIGTFFETLWGDILGSFSRTIDWIVAKAKAVGKLVTGLFSSGNKKGGKAAPAGKFGGAGASAGFAPAVEGAGVINNNAPVTNTTSFNIANLTLRVTEGNAEEAGKKFVQAATAEATRQQVMKEREAMGK